MLNHPTHNIFSNKTKEKEKKFDFGLDNVGRKEGREVRGREVGKQDKVK